MSYSEKHHVVIVGGGIAGLEIATIFGRRCKKKKEQLQVTLVDRDVAHIWKPMLHTIAAGTHTTSQQQVAYILQAYDSGFVYHQGDLIGLDRTEKAITVAELKAHDGRIMIPERKIHYDTLILAVGSKANDFGTPGVSEYCHSIDSRQLAKQFHRELRVQIFQSLSSKKKLEIAIVGGGATGVELSVELIDFIKSTEALGGEGLTKNYSITLIESGPRLLAAFPEDISEATKRRLESLGIDVRLNAKVNSATEDGYLLDGGELIPASLRVWAAGVKADETLSKFDGLETNHNNQLIIRPSLQTTLDDHIFAIGDCSSLTLPTEARPFPPTAQVAHQQAQHIIKYLPKAIFKNQPIPDFKYHDFGSIVSLGAYDAYASLGKFGFLKPTTIRGKLAQLGHIMLYRTHQVMLYGLIRGSLLWMSEKLATKVSPEIDVD